MTYHDVEVPSERIAEFCRSNRIRRLSFFGSILRDDFGPESDIDVLVEFEAGVRIGLRFFGLERELGEILCRKVDLHTLGFLGRRFRDEVLEQAVDQYVAA